MSDSTGSFDGLDDMPLFDESSLPPELEALNQRVLRDSVLWRSDLPRIDALAQQVATLAQRQPESRVPSYGIREELYMQGPSQIETNYREHSATGRPPHRRVRGFLAASAALAIVALFVVFFAALPHGGHTSTSAGVGSGHATATTPTNEHGKWRPIAGLTHTPGVPVISVSNPSVVYEVANGVIRRSSNDGASWTNLPNPADFPAGDSAQWMDLFVSPLSPNTLWTIANLTNSGGAVNCPVPPPFASTGGNVAYGGSNLYGDNILYGGSVPCQVQNVSVDGGQTWKLVKLSFAFMLGTVNADSGFSGPYGQYSAAPLEQGDQIHDPRLYTLTTDGPLAMSNSGGHVAMSSDGGVTWQDASAQLTSAGLDICDLAAVPIGSTLFAVANANGCSIDGATAPSLWRSDDGGGHWHQVTLPPDRFIFGIAATGGAQPRLYAQTATLLHTHAANTAALATDFFASTNGGQTWQQTPAQGVPASVVGSGSMTVLGDGNVVVPFINVDPQAGPTAPATYTFEVWQPGAAAWKKLSQLSLYGIAQLQTLPDPTTNSGALWLTVADSGNPQGSTFSVETYLP